MRSEVHCRCPRTPCRAPDDQSHRIALVFYQTELKVEADGGGDDEGGGGDGDSEQRKEPAAALRPGSPRQRQPGGA